MLNTENFIPNFLKKGDRVALVSPSSCIEKDCLERFLKLMEMWGLEVWLGKNILSRQGVLAGSDKERIQDLQEVINEPSIKAVFASRGGYGLSRIVDSINFDPLKANPKWFIGFSDFCVLHSHIYSHLGHATIHSAMPQNYPKDLNFSCRAIESLRALLFGEALEYRSEPSLEQGAAAAAEPRAVGVQSSVATSQNSASIVLLGAELGSNQGSNPQNIAGKVKAPIVGGNLSILYSLRGTNSDIDPSGKILFLEDLSEFDYHIDRMLVNLSRSGWFRNIAALIVGQFTGIKIGARPMEETVNQMIDRYVKEAFAQGAKYPVLYNFPSGHIDDQVSLYFGKELEFEVFKNGGFRLKML